MTVGLDTFALAAAKFAAKAWRARRHRKAVENAYVEASAAVVTWSEEHGHPPRSDGWNAVVGLFRSEEFAATFGEGGDPWKDEAARIVRRWPVESPAAQEVFSRFSSEVNDRLNDLLPPDLAVAVGILTRRFAQATAGPPSVRAPAIEQTAEPRQAGSLPPVWNVPHRRNANFTGRESILDGLKAALESGRHAAVTQAIEGLGGVGKTQVAVEYAYRRAVTRTDYGLVWWVRAEDPAQLAADYAALAGELGLREVGSQNQEEIRAAVRRWLDTHADPAWLVVFDNAPDPEALAEYLPQAAAGHTIVTSRYSGWDAVAEGMPVPVMQPDEAVEFLKRRCGPVDEDDARALAEELGRLPLALEQAAAFMSEAGWSPRRYLDEFRSSHEALLARRSRSSEYPASVATALAVALTRLRKESSAGAALLDVCAFLAPDNIPLDVIASGAKYLPRPLRSAASDPLRLAEAVAALTRYSLAESAGGMVSVHRLVQAVARDRMALASRKRWAAAAAEVVNAALPGGAQDVRVWPVYARLLAHATAAAGHAERLGVASDTAGRLLDQAGQYLWGRAEFADAGELFGRAIRIDEALYGPDHPTVAIRLNNLANVLQDQGDLTGAWKLFERALAIDEVAYGPEHPSVAIRLNNLATVLQDQGDLTGARELFERALAIDESAYGAAHPTVATRLNNLAGVLQDQGDLTGARGRYERALAIHEGAYGPEHPTVATGLNNLAGVLERQGDQEGARERFERALAIDEAAYGLDHPEVATDLNNLARAFYDQGDLAGARARFERALVIFESVYGPEHPSFATGLNNLASVLHREGNLAGARDLFERALAIDEAAYGPEHPDVAIRLNNLAGVLRDQGDLAGARERFERALTIFENRLGPDHTNTVGVRRQLEALGN